MGCVVIIVCLFVCFFFFWISKDVQLVSVFKQGPMASRQNVALRCEDKVNSIIAVWACNLTGLQRFHVRILPTQDCFESVLKRGPTIQLIREWRCRRGLVVEGVQSPSKVYWRSRSFFENTVWGLFSWRTCGPQYLSLVWEEPICCFRLLTRCLNINIQNKNESGHFEAPLFQGEEAECESHREQIAQWGTHTQSKYQALLCVNSAWY